eukprot:5860144-Amphidinium_carterae.1
MRQHTASAVTATLGWTETQGPSKGGRVCTTLKERALKHPLPSNVLLLYMLFSYRHDDDDDDDDDDDALRRVTNLKSAVFLARALDSSCPPEQH